MGTGLLLAFFTVYLEKYLLIPAPTSMHLPCSHCHIRRRRARLRQSIHRRDLRHSRRRRADRRHSRRSRRLCRRRNSPLSPRSRRPV